MSGQRFHQRKRIETKTEQCKRNLNIMYCTRGISLLRKSVRDFFRTKGFLRIFDGFFLETKGFLPKAYEIFWSEMPLGIAFHFNGSLNGPFSLALLNHPLHKSERRCADYTFPWV